MRCYKCSNSACHVFSVTEAFSFVLSVIFCNILKKFAAQCLTLHDIINFWYVFDGNTLRLYLSRI
jgi:hypothetical protein